MKCLILNQNNDILDNTMFPPKIDNLNFLKNTENQ